MADRPLIVGGGPVGLAAALFLARDGVATRVVEKVPERSPWSRALAVNPRTLSLLKATGVADRIVELGTPIAGGCVWRHGKELARIEFPQIDGQSPRLIALSQAATERLLQQALRSAGGGVEYGVELTDCRLQPFGPEVILRRGEQAETIRPPWLFAADGARSCVRQSMGIPMQGDAMQRPWNLVDVALDTSLEGDRAHITLLDDGLLFLIRVVDDQLPGNIWRVMGNVADPLSRLPAAKPIGEPVWTSSFRIVHRLAGRLSDGPIYLAGDAAHLHSPFGARGMNLGIEDAWTFAELLRQGRPQTYGPLRRRIDGAVVKRIRRLTNVAVGESAFTRGLRRGAVSVATHITAFRRVFARMAMGLDHDLGI